MEKSSPELRAFRKNYVVLLNLRHGIKSVSTEAFAGELINKDLRNKCSDESIADTERTRCLLDALEDKIMYVPSTLQEFVDILKETTGFQYIGQRLSTSLDEEMELQAKAYMKQRGSNNNHSTTSYQDSTESLVTLEEAKDTLKKYNLVISESAANFLGKYGQAMQQNWDQEGDKGCHTSTTAIYAKSSNLELQANFQLRSRYAGINTAIL